MVGMQTTETVWRTIQTECEDQYALINTNMLPDLLYGCTYICSLGEDLLYLCMYMYMVQRLLNLCPHAALHFWPRTWTDDLNRHDKGCWRDNTHNNRDRDSSRDGRDGEEEGLQDYF